MTMHMGVVAVAAPLLAVGAAGGRLDPVRKAPRLFAPIPASVLELVLVWAWHAPVLHHAARHGTAWLAAEQGTFLLTGLVVWLSVFGGDAQGAGPRRAAGVVGLLLTSMHMTLLGALLPLTPRPLYAHTDGFAGLTPLQDQHLGG
jgi:putative membrane protein